MNNTPVLTISLREVLAEEYHTRKPNQTKRHVVAKRMQGIDDILDKEGLASNINAMFVRINIFDNDIELMLNRFVSPLSSSMATSFYHYYIMDTIAVDGKQCIDLAFVPVNSESYGFTGHLYITNDSTYALKKYSINVPPHINMNFVSDLSIEQQFTQLPTGQWAAGELNTFVRFYLFNKMRQIYAYQTVLFDNYDLTATIPDTVFTAGEGDEVIADNARKFTANEWDGMRPLPLNDKESFIDSLLVEFRRVPSFNAVVKTVEIIGSGYVATNSDRSNALRERVG